MACPLNRTRSILGWLAVILGACAVGGWLFGGARLGWTQTSRAVERTDEITGLAYREYERAFRPGVDWLAVGAGAAGAILGVRSLLPRRADAVRGARVPGGGA